MDDVVPGQKCVFLVNVYPPGARDEAAGEISSDMRVGISATVVSGDAAVELNPQSLTALAPGQVLEVIATPQESAVGSEVEIEIRGEWLGTIKTRTVTLAVQEGLPSAGELAALAAELRDMFIPWLAANHPELGIRADIEWESVVVRPHIMVVMYHLFFSNDWEMGIRWHVTIPPHDWVEIYLRSRYTDVHPSYAFKIPSRDSQAEPEPVDVPELWR